MHGVEEAAHLFGGLALDAHGDAEGADFQIRGLAVEHLAQQVGGLRAVYGLGAACAAADFLDVLADAHVGLAGKKKGAGKSEWETLARRAACAPGEPVIVPQVR